MKVVRKGLSADVVVGDLTFTVGFFTPPNKGGFVHLFSSPLLGGFTAFWVGSFCFFWNRHHRKISGL